MNDWAASSRTTAGIVLAGTYHWTNSSFDTLMPRVLLPVAHRPLIAYAFSWLHQGGIGDVSICANRGMSALKPHVGRHIPLGMTWSYHEDPVPRGAAGSIRDAATAHDADTFVVADGTAIPNVDLPALLASHRASGATVTVVVHNEHRRNGNPCLQVPTGIYVFEKRALEFVPPHGFYDIKERLIPELYRAGERIVAYPTEGAIPRVLGASTYLAVNEWMVEQLIGTAECPDGYVKVENCLFHRAASIDEDAMFVGPVLVEAGARVNSGAVVVGPTSIGRDVTIECDALVSRSAVWRRCVVGEQAVTDRCVLADDTIVESATQSFRSILVAERRRVPDNSKSRTPGNDYREGSALELGRRVGRRLIDSDWSRAPAAP